MTELVEQKSFSLAPKNIDEALRLAEMLAKSDLVPKDFQNKPGNILVAVQWGSELGLQPLQSMQNIAVINGRPSLWGDSVIAIVKASPLCEYIVEETTDTQSTCKVKRRGEPEQFRTFTMDDAAKAGLKGKSGTWTQYPKRMLQMRARSWALRDVFPDVLRGMPIAEELMDIPEKDVTPINKTLEPKEPDYYTNDEFATRKEKWRQAVIEGKQTNDNLIIFAQSKGKLFTEAQLAEIMTWKKIEVVDNPPQDPFVADMEAAEKQNNNV